MQNQETTTQPTSESKRAQKIDQLEASIEAVIPQLRRSHERILAIEKEISRLSEDDPFESSTEEFSLEPELDTRMPLDGEPLEFDSDDNEDVSMRMPEFAEFDETDMSEFDLIEAQDRLNTEYMHAIAEFRRLANDWFESYHQLQPLKSNSPVLGEIDVDQLSGILKRISE